MYAAILFLPGTGPTLALYQSTSMFAVPGSGWISSYPELVTFGILMDARLCHRAYEEIEEDSRDGNRHLRDRTQ